MGPKHLVFGGEAFEEQVQRGDPVYPEEFANVDFAL